VQSLGVFIITTLPLLVVTFGLFFRRAAGGPTFGLQGGAVVYETLRQLSGYSDVLVFFYIIFFCVGVYVIAQNGAGKALLLATLLIVPLIASVILAGIIPMVPRYLIYLLPFLCIGVAAAFDPLARALQSGRVTYGVILLLVLAQVPFLAGYYSAYAKDDWRGFAAFVRNETAPGDVVVLVPGYLDQPFDYYYSNVTDGTLEYGASDRPGLERIAGMFADRKMFFVMTPDINSADPGQEALGWLSGNATVRVRWEQAIFFLERR
jgi:hypothetical protein